MRDRFARRARALSDLGRQLVPPPRFFERSDLFQMGLNRLAL